MLYQSRKLIAFQDLAVVKVGRLENALLVGRGKNHTNFFIRIKFYSLRHSPSTQELHTDYT